MIILSILLIVLLTIVGVVLGTTLLFGGTILALFGDLILCGVAVWLIVKLFKRIKKKK